MAAFCYQELPFLVDCVLTPDMMLKLSSSASSSTITSPLLSPSRCLLSADSNYPDPVFHGEELQYQFGNFVDFHQGEFKPVDFSLHQGIAQSTPGSSDNETNVIPKQSTLNVGAGALNQTPVNNKRKLKRDGSSPKTSKGLRGGRSKKPKKNNNGGVKKEGGEAEEEQEQKKTPSPSPSTSPSPSAAEESPKGYIHVRAKRGQATDSHSLAERARREKISERMKLLQALVPGCDKVTGKASMLDEIINYVRSLQTQVEFLSLRLSSLTPMVYSFGLDLDSLLLGHQGLRSTAPLVGLAQQFRQRGIEEAGVGNGATTTGMTTVFHQQGERGSIPLCVEEDNGIGSGIRGLGGQGGPDPVNQPGFCINNNMMY